jgi:6-pyruvoyltetrahydropterin/6-carboxytetrahydropterin synthase
MREVRCFLTEAEGTAEVVNSWSGALDTNSLGPFWVLRAVIDGPVDEQTGYLCSITEVDSMLRAVVLPPLRERASPPLSTNKLTGALAEVFPSAAEHCPAPAALDSLTLRVSPFLTFAVARGDRKMVQLTESFEFSASHRLYCQTMSDEENLRVFGKCSNPNGHGHNYVLEVTIAGTPDEHTGTLIDLPAFERIVKERVIDRFDHKHLNLDCPEFASLNPSVENITRVIWKCLAGALEPSRLAKIRVWETPKTYAEYTGSD